MRTYKTNKAAQQLFMYRPWTKWAGGSELATRATLCLTPESELSSLANTCITYREGVKVDIAWTRYRFSEICWLLLNGNDYKFFLQVFQDANGNAKFAKNQTARADQREEWAWNTITGKAKTPAGIGFYPTNINGESRWGAMDFDAHGQNEKLQARERAFAAFDVLKRHCQHRLLLGTSGGGGWHLFVFATDFYPIDQWIRFLEEVALRIRAPIQKGVCEIFPSSTRGRHGGGGIRAPGTWNPKNGKVGLLFEDQVSPALEKLALRRGEEAGSKRREEVMSYLYHATTGLQNSQLHDKSTKTPVFGGSGVSDLAAHFAVTAAGTRSDQLNKLVGEKYRSCGHELVRQVAELQHKQATPKPDASLSEHLVEFENFWSFYCDLWHGELSECERLKLNALATANERDAFRIIRGLWQLRGAARDIPISTAYLARQIGMTWQGVAKMRGKIESLGIMRKTAECVKNKFAARYEWTANNQRKEPTT